MGWTLRKSTDKVNPTLAGGVYGRFITAGRGVYWNFDGSRMRFLLFISDGGRYGIDSITELSYGGGVIAPADYRLHRGLLTKQISPRAITAVSTGADTLTFDTTGLVDDDPIRLNVRGGAFPTVTGSTIVTTEKYFLRSVTGTTAKIALTAGGTALDITAAGSGTLTIWKADAGFDDPEQGLPEYVPEVDITFSGIAYVEGLMPATFDENTEPTWDNFRVVGLGRRLMDYSNVGAELGITTNEDDLCNPALADADMLLYDYKKPATRMDWASWKALRDAAAVLLWQRVDTSEAGSGLIGKYYNYVGSPPPDVMTGTLALTRKDSVLSFYVDDGQGPGPGVNGSFFVVWEGRIKPKFTETYTFKTFADNGARVYINGVAVIDRWDEIYGTDTGTVAMTAGVLADIRVEWYDSGGPGSFSLSWSSTSQMETLVPQDVMYDADLQVPRYEISIAAAQPIECNAYHELIMQKCPGWRWTDVDGLITYLPPDSAVVFDFAFDAIDDDVRATFLDKTFEKKRRNRRDRRNFVLYSYRNRNETGYPERYVEQNRARLRELGGGMPNNDPPEELMVMTRSLAERIADLDMKFTSDPAYSLSLSGRKAAAVATKSHMVHVRNWVADDRRIEDSYCIVESLTRQGKQVDLELLPVPYPFYDDSADEV